MLEVMMALGSYRFAVGTAAYRGLERSASWRWPAQERLGAHPVRQYTGPGEQVIRLDGVIHPHYRGLLGLPNLLARIPPLAGGIGYLGRINSGLTRLGLGIPGRTGTWALERLRQDADSGRPLMLVDGRGRVWGCWVITELQEAETRHFGDGQALAIDFSASLAYYGEDADAGLGADTSVGGLLRDLLGV